MNRRSFIYRISRAVALLVLAALPYGLSRLLVPGNTQAALTRDPRINHHKLRPPGALENEEDFLAACIGCGLCGEVCPPACIQFYHRDGGDSANTPYILPPDKGCILCGKCMDVCPTPALTVTSPQAVTMGVAQIDRLACYPWIDRGVCGACASICPLGERAIGFEFANMYRPVINSGCVGCGLCVEICPHPSLPIRIIAQSPTTVSHTG